MVLMRQVQSQDEDFLFTGFTFDLLSSSQKHQIQNFSLASFEYVFASLTKYLSAVWPSANFFFLYNKRVMFTDSNFLRISRKLCGAWRTVRFTQKRRRSPVCLIFCTLIQTNPHFNDAGIHPTSDLWQQLESVQSAKQTAPQLRNNCTAIHTTLHHYS